MCKLDKLTHTPALHLFSQLDWIVAMTRTSGIAFAISLIINMPNHNVSAANYNEDKVPEYNLTDPLNMKDGTPVSSAKEWERKRRPEILNLFREHVYGHSKKKPSGLKFKVIQNDPTALGGNAIRREILITFARKEETPEATLLVYLPKDQNGPFPTFLTTNFYGNHTINSDPGISITRSWVRNEKKWGIENNRAGEKSRGVRQSRWSVEKILNRGYALATIYYGDIDPDFDDNFSNGVHRLYSKPKPNEWGSIATWAWGLSRCLDYMETDKDINAKKVTVMGHSRLGKTALWAGAEDERFALVISNNSGCGGAALSRREFGETVKKINTSFPHWFCDNFTNYNDRVNDLPVDQHLLISLIAPRPVYIASATQDKWADPKGEFLSAYHASSVYELFNLKGLNSPKQPKNDHSVGHNIGYHIRTGKHDVTDFDWEQYLNFADRHLK
ncbi:MAG: acetylxylan esterase [Verrucomicrobiota bacterium]|nr:acetylxylan esterase [Verrucomicrobiota bacterium]